MRDESLVEARKTEGCFLRKSLGRCNLMLEWCDGSSIKRIICVNTNKKAVVYGEVIFDKSGDRSAL